MWNVGDWVQCLIIGLVFGFSCGFLRVPIPAPPTVAGVMGILGVTLGFIISTRLGR